MINPPDKTGQNPDKTDICPARRTPGQNPPKGRFSPGVESGRTASVRTELILSGLNPPDDGVLIPYGQDITSGRMLHVTAVARGAACNCVCPACNTPLISRQGERNAWHFAHTADDPNCRGALETALHKAAKQIIADEGWLRAPPLYARHPNGNPSVRAAQPGGTIVLAEVHPEFTGFLPDFKPDLLATSRAGTPLIIEIHVHHAVNQPKADRIRDRDIAAIEITLTGFRSMEHATWRDAVLRNAPRRWLHHPRQAELDAELAATVAEHRLQRMRQQNALEAARLTQLAEQNAIREQQAALWAADDPERTARVAAEKQRQRDEWNMRQEITLMLASRRREYALASARSAVEVFQRCWTLIPDGETVLQRAKNSLAILEATPDA